MPHGSHADIIYEYDNQIYRCQVKTVTHIEKGRISWRFDLRKGSHSKTRKYQDNTIDVFALVNLKYQNVFFLPFNNCKYLQYSVHDHVMKTVDSIQSFKDAMESMTLTDGRQIGISVHDIPLRNGGKQLVFNSSGVAQPVNADEYTNITSFLIVLFITNFPCFLYKS